ncbi:hypothetical protein BDP27DRAFT_1325493 [Rhodocollybia butyracea]|uniref:Uncharacterized protein n=1 Tax=Rhodocollybia butyracea TaxID=206335 RepID=A0A9P5PP62_9AGAR|nr:hypothetical protein BDP27DRAFT_1325493 [Rhodocollybia butyracea]
MIPRTLSRRYSEGAAMTKSRRSQSLSGNTDSNTPTSSGSCKEEGSEVNAFSTIFLSTSRTALEISASSKSVSEA